MGMASVLLVIGGLIHGRAYGKAVFLLNSANLPPFYEKSFMVLWLSDSTTLIAVGIQFALLAVRPTAVTSWFVLAIALVPAATAVLLYYFIGNFLPAHMLAIASMFAVLGALFSGSR
jgi:hypothetical protein